MAPRQDEGNYLPRENVGRISANSYSRDSYTSASRTGANGGARSARPQRPAQNGNYDTNTGTPHMRNAAQSGMRPVQTGGRPQQNAHNYNEVQPQGMQRGSTYSRNGQSYSRGGESSYVASQRSNGKGSGKSKAKFIIAAAIALAVIIAGVLLFLYLQPINVTINGKSYSINGAKTVATAFDAAKPNVQPGDFVDVTGAVLEEGKGNAYDAWVNDEQVTDMSTKLHAGDNVQFSDGSDITEEWTGTDKEIVATFDSSGVGALGVLKGTGKSGIETTMTGKISGKTATKVTTEPDNVTFLRYNAYAGTDKVIALTFDDGPTTYTTEILALLKQYDAKATFFILGEQCEEDWEKEILKAEYEAGHQLCTHTYSHAASGRADGKTGSLGYLTDSQILADVTKGMQALADALGLEEAPSKVMRAPSGYFDADIAKVLQGTITAEINWNIDTMDWSLPGVNHIVNQMMNAYPGAVILFHDGGGDRSQTVAALREALPQLAAQGYKFITIDELLKYPASNE